MHNWLQDHLGWARLALVVLVCLNLFSLQRTLFLFPLLASAHLFVALLLLLGVIFVH